MFVPTLDPRTSPIVWRSSGTKAELYSLLDQLAQEGLAILVISSDLPEVLALADRVLVMCRGKLTGELDRGEATEEKIMSLAALGSEG